VWLAYVLNLLNLTAATGATMATALYVDRMGVSTALVDALLSVPALAAVGFGVLAGRLADRDGARESMRFGSLMMAGALLAAAATPSFEIQCAAVFLLGLGFLLFMVAHQRVIGDASKASSRARHFANHSMAYSIGGFLGPLAASVLIERHGFGPAFATLGLIPLASAALLCTDIAVRSFPEMPRDQQRLRISVNDLLKQDRALLYVIVASALALSVADAFQLWGALHARASGLSPGGVAIVTGAFGAASISVRLCMPQLIALAGGAERLLYGCLVLSAFACVVVPLVDSLPMLVLSSLLLGAGLGCAQPLTMLMTYAGAPRGCKSEAFGWRFACVSAMRLLVPLALVSTSKFGSAFWAAVVILCVGARLSYLLMKKNGLQENGGENEVSRRRTRRELGGDRSPPC